jgi:hypothetical protein
MGTAVASAAAVHMPLFMADWFVPCPPLSLPGSGVQVPIDGRVTIDGLQACETYNFAVAGEWSVCISVHKHLSKCGAKLPMFTQSAMFE